MEGRLNFTDSGHVCTRRAVTEVETLKRLLCLVTPILRQLHPTPAPISPCVNEILANVDLGQMNAMTKTRRNLMDGGELSKEEGEADTRILSGALRPSPNFDPRFSVQFSKVGGSETISRRVFNSWGLFNADSIISARGRVSNFERDRDWHARSVTSNNS